MHISRKNLLMSINAPMGNVMKTEPVSFQWCPVSEQEALGQNRNMGDSA